MPRTASPVAGVSVGSAAVSSNPHDGVAADAPRTRTLSEAASKALLASCGVPVLTERVVSTSADAAAAATELGFPV
ncbi:MAG: acetate--CoA ligase family protein, partial [Acidimicrobiales bacterium]